jgi:hypothetical protein
MHDCPCYHENLLCHVRGFGVYYKPLLPICLSSFPEQQGQFIEILGRGENGRVKQMIHWSWNQQEI